MEVIQNFDTYLQDSMFRLGFFYGILFICIILIIFILISKVSQLLDKKIKEK